ncbi:MAG: M48 family metalloprotease [Pseudomonadota bacterium]
MSKILTLLIPLAIAITMFRVNAVLSGRSLRAKSRPLRNDEVERALTRLAAAAGIDHIRVRVFDEAQINGLVTPEGDIYVTSGLVDKLRGGKVSMPEFVSVIAHELGHLAHGHTKRRIWDVAGSHLLVVILGGLIARVIPFVGYYIARFLSSLFVSALSRKDEFEADSYATALMIKAGFGAEPQARMLEKLIELVPGAERISDNWLASHPPVPERAAAIRGNAERWTA